MDHDREMRKAERKLTREEAEDVLGRGEYGVLCTLCGDGFPYGVPISYVYRGGCILMHHTNADSLLSENIGSGARTSFTVVGGTEVIPAKFSTVYESAVAFGTVVPVEGRTEKIDALNLLVAKYSPGFDREGAEYAETAADRVTIFSMRVESLTGKARRPKPANRSRVRRPPYTIIIGRGQKGMWGRENLPSFLQKFSCSLSYL